jgi:hypothetical protein
MNSDSKKSAQHSASQKKYLQANYSTKERKGSMVQNINFIKVKSILEIESPYSDDVQITKYYCRISEDHEDWAKAYRSVQTKLRDFEKFTLGEFTRDIRGRVTDMQAFDEWLKWKERTRPLSRKPKFVFESKEF